MIAKSDGSDDSTECDDDDWKKDSEESEEGNYSGTVLNLANSNFNCQNPPQIARIHPTHFPYMSLPILLFFAYGTNAILWQFYKKTQNMMDMIKCDENVKATKMRCD